MSVKRGERSSELRWYEALDMFRNIEIKEIADLNKRENYSKFDNQNSFYDYLKKFERDVVFEFVNQKGYWYIVASSRAIGQMPERPLGYVCIQDDYKPLAHMNDSWYDARMRDENPVPMVRSYEVWAFQNHLAVSILFSYYWRNGLGWILDKDRRSNMIVLLIYVAYLTVPNARTYRSGELLVNVLAALCPRYFSWVTTSDSAVGDCCILDFIR